MKCGTSALYVYLLDHPGILPAKSKEPAFWQRRKVQTIDGAARLIDDEYRRKFFPPLAVQVPTQVCTPWLERDESGIIYEAESLCKERLPGRHYIVGDHTAAVLSQGSPAVLHHWYPHARLVVLVRDPSQRVLSHYRMWMSTGTPLPPFHDFVKAGIDKVTSCDFDPACAANDSKGPANLILQGLYAQLVRKWEEWFDTEQLLVVRSSDLDLRQATVAQAAGAMGRIVAHIGLPPHDFTGVLGTQHNLSPPLRGANNSGTAPSTGTATAESPNAAPTLKVADRRLERVADGLAMLDALFAPHNRELEALLGWAAGSFGA